jgi:hypothetical protein
VAEIRGRCIAGLSRLPARYRSIDRTAEYPVHYTKRLKQHLEKLRRRIRKSAPK